MSANQSFLDISSLPNEDQKQLRKLTEKFINGTKNKSSVAIGGQGEELVKKVIENAKIFDLTDVRKEGHKGDFVISKNGVKVMIEVKSHTNIIPAKERMKFWSDLEANKDYQAGIFIAVNTKIAGLPKNEKLRFSENGNKLGLFIEEFCKLTDEDKITTLKASYEMLSNFVSALKNRGKPLKKITNKKCEKNCAKTIQKKTNKWFADRKVDLDDQLLVLKQDSKLCIEEIKRIQTLIDNTQNPGELEKLYLEQSSVFQRQKQVLEKSQLCLEKIKFVKLHYEEFLPIISDAPKVLLKVYCLKITQNVAFEFWHFHQFLSGNLL